MDNLYTNINWNTHISLDNQSTYEHELQIHLSALRREAWKNRSATFFLVGLVIVQIVLLGILRIESMGCGK